jgi:hypothetical protein
MLKNYSIDILREKDMEIEKILTNAGLQIKKMLHSSHSNLDRFEFLDKKIKILI